MADDPATKPKEQTKLAEQKKGKWSDDSVTKPAGPFKTSKTADLESSDYATTKCESKELEGVLRRTRRLTVRDIYSEISIEHSGEGETSWQETVLRVDDGPSYEVMWMSTDDETHVRVRGPIIFLGECSLILAPLCPNVEHLVIYVDPIHHLHCFPHRIMPMKSVITLYLQSLIKLGTLEDILLAVSKSYPNAQIVDLQVMHLDQDVDVFPYNEAYTHEIDLPSLTDLTIRGDTLSEMAIPRFLERYPDVKVTVKYDSQSSHEDSKQGMGMTFKLERKTSPYAPHSSTSSIGELMGATARIQVHEEQTETQDTDEEEKEEEEEEEKKEDYIAMKTPLHETDELIGATARDQVHEEKEDTQNTEEEEKEEEKEDTISTGSLPHETDGKKVRWDFLTDSSELKLKDDEVVISCGIRFWPSGAKLSEPFKVTLDHNAHFTDPSLAEIVFYTRTKDSNTFKRIPASTDGCPARCVVRSKDLDFYVDHFCDWWIVTTFKRIFVGKWVECAPYVLPPVMKGRMHLVILCIYDDLPGVIQKTQTKMKPCSMLCPSHQMFVEWKFGDIKIELFGGRKQIDETMWLSTRDMNLLERKQFSFEVESLESGASEISLKFACHQSGCPSEPTLIRFILRYDDVPKAPAAGASSTMHAIPQAAGVSPLSGQTTREEGNQVKPDDKGCYTQLMQAANPSPDQLDPEQNYKMDALTKGHMFILNMTKDREGSDVDAKNVKHVFEQIGYEIEFHSDLTDEKLKDELGTFVTSSFHEGMCSAVYLFMGHGDEEGIICAKEGFPEKEEVVTTKYIKDKVSEMNSMVGKPKMIFFQCCRGEDELEKEETYQAKTDKAIPDKSDKAISAKSDKAMPAKSDKAIPAKSDVLIVVHATTDGNVAYRDPYDGSWFIQMLCEELLKNAHVSDLLTMLEQVTGKVAELTSEEDLKEYGQCLDVGKQGITKKIYFLPKYSSAKNE